jgi:hypothetical protein
LLPAESSFSQHHECVSILVDLQLAEESEGVDQFLHTDCVAEVLPEDFEDEHLQHALLLPIRRDEGDDGEFLQGEFLLDSGVLLGRTLPAGEPSLVLVDLILVQYLHLPQEQSQGHLPIVAVIVRDQVLLHDIQLHRQELLL